MIPPQHLIVSPEPPAALADYWEQMTQAAPEVFNVAFVLVAALRYEGD